MKSVYILLLLLCSLTLNVRASFYDVRTFGAVGDGTHDDTSAIQHTLDLCAKNNGGTVSLTKGTHGNTVYSSRPIWISSNTVFVVEQGVTLLGSSRFTAYPPAWTPVGHHVAALVNIGRCTKENEHGCLHFEGARNVTIKGGGTVDGNGQFWWWGRTWYPDNPRPRLCAWNNVHGLHVHHVTFVRPASHHIVVNNCTDVVMEYSTIDARVDWDARPWNGQDNGFNTDGFDTFNCRNVIFRHNNVHAGDDCICVFAPLPGLPVQNHMYYNNSCQSPVSIGAHNSKSQIRDIVFKDFRVNTKWAEGDKYPGLEWKPRWWRTAIRLKSNFGQPGAVSNILYDGFNISDVDMVIDFQTYSFCQNSSGTENWKFCTKKNSAGGHTPPKHPTEFASYHNITFKNIEATGVWRSGWLPCLKESPCTDIQFQDVNIECSVGWDCSEYVHGKAVNTHPSPVSQGCLKP